ncbi:MAG: hypothetical protein HYZ69_01865 [Candidatus Colwellbacteria bacterium]|nr:hypothetical protein [Candidatus Colwellbacteria bacterium]
MELLGIMIGTFSAQYGKTGIIGVAMGICALCRNKKRIISIDSSGGEYGAGNICKECVMKAIDTYREANKT